MLPGQQRSEAERRRPQWPDAAGVGTLSAAQRSSFLECSSWMDLEEARRRPEKGNGRVVGGRELPRWWTRERVAVPSGARPVAFPPGRNRSPAAKRDSAQVGGACGTGGHLLLAGAVTDDESDCASPGRGQAVDLGGAKHVGQDRSDSAGRGLGGGGLRKPGSGVSWGAARCECRLGR